jgi:hypothetical protein
VRKRGRSHSYTQLDILPWFRAPAISGNAGTRAQQRACARAYQGICPAHAHAHPCTVSFTRVPDEALEAFCGNVWVHPYIYLTSVSARECCANHWWNKAVLSLLKNSPVHLETHCDFVIHWIVTAECPRMSENAACTKIDSDWIKDLIVGPEI